MGARFSRAQERLSTRYTAIDALHRVYWFMPYAPESVRFAIGHMKVDVRASWRVCQEVVWC